MITSNVNKLRDPFVLPKNGIYYMYGTGWEVYKNTSKDLGGDWISLGNKVLLSDPNDDGGCHWAPEVHEYNGYYYMITTYLSKSTAHRGCAVFRSDSPEGPFIQISDGHITPHDIDAIDGTLYKDPAGQLWMVFVHEWTCKKDHIGSFAAAKLSSDLSHFISDPIELFSANEPKWAVRGVTDGCFMYTSNDGKLLMTWSNFASDGYCMGVSRSREDRLDGHWTHDDEPIYSRTMQGMFDGGHGMIFRAFDGDMYIAFHAPNTPVGDRLERPCFAKVMYSDGHLTLDI